MAFREWGLARGVVDSLSSIPQPRPRAAAIFGPNLRQIEAIGKTIEMAVKDVPGTPVAFPEIGTGVAVGKAAWRQRRACFIAQLACTQ